MKYPIPDAALSAHMAVLGKTGSGKTSTAKLAIEQVVAQGARVCILDPIKSDWWGLTSSADGRRPGMPFQILGGPHGHVPLTSSAGAAVAELVAGSDLPLSIVDMALFEPGGLQKFFIDFADVLLNRMRGVVYLVLEEAHEFAPKERDGFGNINMAVFWAKKLATAGRSKGIRLIVATQRTQALHNALLGSCETLIAHRLVLEADQKPVLGWLKNLDKTLVSKVGPTLARLPTGTGWLCSGEAMIFEEIAFPRISTFDNTATPTGELADRKVKQAPIDVAKLRALIGEKVVEAEANDPIKLKARISELETAARKEKVAPARGASEASAAGLAAAEQRGYERGLVDGEARGLERGAKAGWKAAATCLLGQPRASEQRAPAPPAATARPNGHDAGNGALPPAKRKILDALAWLEWTGQAAPARNVVAFVGGISSKSSSYANNVSALRSAGLIAYPGDGALTLTAAGRALAARPTKRLDHAAMMDALSGKLAPAQMRVLRAAVQAHPKPLSREQVAAGADASPASSSFANNVSRLSSLGLVTYPASGMVRAADLLFPGG